MATMTGRSGTVVAVVVLAMAGVGFASVRLVTDGGGSGRAGCEGYVALTFDDGPSAATHDYLDALDEHRIRATFFVSGAEVERRPEEARRIAADAHELANHAYDHPFLDDLSEDLMRRNLQGASQIIEETTGQVPAWFRPPYGRTDPAIRQAAEDYGMVEVLWTVDTLDWRDGITAEGVAERAAEARDGDILLLHDDEGLATYDALPLIAAWMDAHDLCAGRIVADDDGIDDWAGDRIPARAGPW